MQRTDSGIYAEMKERMEKEFDPFTLIDVAMDDKYPRDIRQTAANRLNDLRKGEVSAYLFAESDANRMARIGRSHMFPTSITCLAKARAKEMQGLTDIDLRILAAVQEQNRLLKQLTCATARS